MIKTKLWFFCLGGGVKCNQLYMHFPHSLLVPSMCKISSFPYRASKLWTITGTFHLELDHAFCLLKKNSSFRTFFKNSFKKLSPKKPPKRSLQYVSLFLPFLFIWLFPPFSLPLCLSPHQLLSQFFFPYYLSNSTNPSIFISRTFISLYFSSSMSSFFSLFLQDSTWQRIAVQPPPHLHQ